MIGAKVARGKWIRGKLRGRELRALLQCAVGQHVRNKVGLELVQVNVQGAIETEGRGDRGDDLGDEPVQVGEAGRADVQTLLADVVNGLVVDLKGK